MQIDHDPKEPSRKALKLIAVLTAVITLAVMVPVSMGIRWGVDQLPQWLIAPILVAFISFAAGFFIGRWDGRREFGLAKPFPFWAKENLLPVLKRLACLLPSAPFAIFLLPLASWRKARNDGAGLYVRAMSFITGLVIGTMITLGSITIIIAPITIILGT